MLVFVASWPLLLTVSEIILLNKPFNVLSQFSGDEPAMTLAAYVNAPGFYPAGRLDKDSEGLLLLTNDGALQQKISNPKHKMTKRYLVQVEGEIDSPALARLCEGVQLKDGMTRPAIATAIADPDVWPRIPPIRERKTVPTSWLSLSIREGRNRQVRRMTAAVGHPTLRLIRWSIGPWELQTLRPGETTRLSV